MQRSLPFAVAVFVAFAGSLAPARAADEKVLRHLAFSVSAGVAQTMEQSRTTQIAPGGESGSAIGVSGGTATSSAQEITRGTVTIDIIGVLPSDDALAIKIAESGDKTIPPVRIDLLGDGRIVAAPEDQAKLSSEELEIAGLCARDYLAGRPVTTGSVWDVDADNGKANYRVMKAGDDGRASIVVEKNSHARTAGAGDQRSTMQLTYDVKRSVPVAATISRRSHVGSLGNLRTLDESFEYHLIADSFATAAK